MFKIRQVYDYLVPTNKDAVDQVRSRSLARYASTGLTGSVAAEGAVVKDGEGIVKPYSTALVTGGIAEDEGADESGMRIA